MSQTRLVGGAGGKVGRRTVRFASLGLTSLALGACAVGPTYVRPPIVQSTAFRAAPLAAARVGSAVAPLDRWWTGFGDPSWPAWWRARWRRTSTSPRPKLA